MKYCSARPIAAPAHVRTHIPLGALTLGEVAVLWHLTRGGLALSEAIKVAGVKGNACTIKSLVAAFGMAVIDSLPLAGRVRCKGCGGKLVSVPCMVCGPTNPRYMVSSYAGDETN